MEWGEGIWLDKCNANTRICGNIVLNLRHADHGGIFNEARLNPILVDHNLVAGVGLHVDAKGEVFIELIVCVYRETCNFLVDTQ